MMYSLGYTLGNVAFVRARRSVFDTKKIKRFFAYIPALFQLKN